MIQQIHQNPISSCYINNRKKQPAAVLKTNFDSVSFKGKISPQSIKSPNCPNIEVLEGTSEDFFTNISKAINSFSPEWLKEFKKKGYKIIISPSIEKAFKMQGVSDLDTLNAERQNPKGTFGVTYSERFGKKFFVFCDKAPASCLYTQNIVNHEFSHGIINIKKLDKDKNVKGMIDRDIQELITQDKLKQMSSQERHLLVDYLLKSSPKFSIDEIAAETIAWLKGAGCYGSGLVLGVKSPKLVLEAFGNLAKYISNNVI